MKVVGNKADNRPLFIVEIVVSADSANEGISSWIFI
jgi:hypothetical protein